MVTDRAIILVVALTSGLALPGFAQQAPDPGSLLKAQREAMAALHPLDGTWRGSASTTLPTGETHLLTQTERVGPFLGGAVKVIEGRGVEADGQLSFNALAIISYDVERRSYSLRSYAQGRVGDFPVRVTSDGFAWDIPAGAMLIRYTAVIKDGIWHEIGERIVPGQDPIRFHEMTLRRVGDTDWPAGGAVPPR